MIKCEQGTRLKSFLFDHTLIGQRKSLPKGSVQHTALYSQHSDFIQTKTNNFHESHRRMDAPKMDSPEDLGANKGLSAPQQCKPAAVEGMASNKKQPWKDFFAPGAVAAEPTFRVTGNGAIRLGAELDDKDLGG